MSEKKKKFYITAPLYYVNGEPHIGHAYTTIVADVLARFYRHELGDNNVYFLTGTDEHGAKVAEAAAKRGMEPQAFVDKISAQFKAVWQELEVTPNDFWRTTDPAHIKIVVDIINTLKQAQTPAGNDVLYEADYEGLYCVGCEKFIFASELVDGKCPLHNKVPEQVKEKNWFFRLQDFLPTIKKFIESDQLLIYPVSRKNEVLGLIDKQTLPDFSISRSIKSVPWGIDLPWDKTQKVYVWVDALSNYITALGYPNGKLYKKFWPAEAQIMALDILKFHALYWPAILLALKLPLPKALYIHGFFTIDGQKMSKTIGNVIRPDELVQTYGPDVTKYLILSQFSFGAESDIKVEDFPKKYNADLVNGLGNLVSRVTNMIASYLDGHVSVDKKKIKPVGAAEIINFKFREALLSIWQLIQQANSQIDQTKPWELAKSIVPADKKKLKQILEYLAQDLYQIAAALEPFMPDTSAKIIRIITAKKISKPAEPLFPRKQ
ncbi:MAG: methionine--tRNA ligase [Parcubacteria group bacterium]|nr:MAG: methionine--tRNA ligase [Parcubacteria group bacterium]